MTSAAFEKLVRTCLSLPSNPAVIDIESFVIGWYTNKTDGVYERHADVLEYYSIPTLNFDLSSTPEFRISDRHPTWPWHQFIADFMAFTFKNEYFKSCGNHVKSPIKMYEHLRGALSEFCVNPFTLIRADHPGSFKDIPITSEPEGAWTFGEDVVGNGKMGWHIDDIKGGKISFKINVDMYFKYLNASVIGIGYLKSYEGMGTVKVYTNNNKDRFIYINGTNDNSENRVSMVYSVRACVPKQSNVTSVLTNLVPREKITHILVDPLPFLLPDCNPEFADKLRLNKQSFHYCSEDLNFELLPAPSGSLHNKFKIVYILSC